MTGETVVEVEWLAAIDETDPVSWVTSDALRSKLDDVLTVSTKVSLAVRLPSRTRTVIVAVPVRFRAGVILSVRFDPLPPKTMLAFGTSVVFEDEPLTIRLETLVSRSLMVNGIAAVCVLRRVD